MGQSISRLPGNLSNDVLAAKFVKLKGKSAAAALCQPSFDSVQLRPFDEDDADIPSTGHINIPLDVCALYHQAFDILRPACGACRRDVEVLFAFILCEKVCLNLGA